MKPSRKRYRSARRVVATLVLLFFLLLGQTASEPVIAQPTPIRRVNPSAIATQVYEQIPTLPLENQYLSTDTGTQAVDNTLVSRLIRYHLYIADRPTVFRLDWKLTLADYLGAFQTIESDRYIDYGLNANPYSSDLAAIEALSPAQRNELVNVLYEAFTTPADETGSLEDS